MRAAALTASPKRSPSLADGLAGIQPDAERTLILRRASAVALIEAALDSDRAADSGA